MANMDIMFAPQFTALIKQTINTEIVFGQCNAERILVQLTKLIQRHAPGGNPPWYKGW